MQRKFQTGLQLKCERVRQLQDDLCLYESSAVSAQARSLHGNNNNNNNNAAMPLSKTLQVSTATREIFQVLEAVELRIQELKQRGGGGRIQMPRRMRGGDLRDPDLFKSMHHPLQMLLSMTTRYSHIHAGLCVDFPMHLIIPCSSFCRRKWWGGGKGWSVYEHCNGC